MKKNIFEYTYDEIQLYKQKFDRGINMGEIMGFIVPFQFCPIERAIKTFIKENQYPTFENFTTQILESRNQNIIFECFYATSFLLNETERQLAIEALTADSELSLKLWLMDRTLSEEEMNLLENTFSNDPVANKEDLINSIVDKTFRPITRNVINESEYTQGILELIENNIERGIW